MGPLDLYQAAISRGEIQSDVAQLRAMERLQNLYLALTKQEDEPGLIAKLFAKPKRERIPGLYFWGGVGRGKTFLMDLFLTLCLLGRNLECISTGSCATSTAP